MLKTILLAILLPIAIILVLMLIFIIHISRQTRCYKENLKIASENINNNRQNVLGTKMKRISMIANSNSNFTSLKHEIEIVYNDFFNNIELAKKKLSHLKVNIKRPHISFKKIKKEYEEIKGFYPILNRIEGKFDILSNQIIITDNMIRNEFSFYKSCMRKAINVFKEKRILLDEIAKEIENFIIETKEIEVECEKVIDKGLEQESIEMINIYIKKVVRFIDIINECPALSIQLKSQIKNTVEKLTELYLSKKNTNLTSIPLKHIEFKLSIKEIHNKFEKAHVFLKKLDIPNTKKQVIKILKSFKTIESQINLEVESQKIFLKIYQPLINQAEDIFSKWNKIKKQFNQVTSSGQIVNNDLLEKYTNIQKRILTFNSKLLDLKKIAANKSSPYSAKFQRCKFLSFELENLFSHLNDFVEELWNINYEESQIKQKFKRAEMAINDLIANTKYEKVNLTEKENKEFYDIISQKTKLAKMIDNTINKDTRESINTFSKKVINFYLLINGKIQIAIHIKNILKEFANQRSSDLKLNLGLQAVEKYFLERQYTIGLNQAIETIKEYLK